MIVKTFHFSGGPSVHTWEVDNNYQLIGGQSGYANNGWVSRDPNLDASGSQLSTPTEDDSEETTVMGFPGFSAIVFFPVPYLLAKGDVVKIQSSSNGVHSLWLQLMP